MRRPACAGVVCACGEFAVSCFRFTSRDKSEHRFALELQFGCILLWRCMWANYQQRWPLPCDRTAKTALIRRFASCARTRDSYTHPAGDAAPREPRTCAATARKPCGDATCCGCCLPRPLLAEMRFLAGTPGMGPCTSHAALSRTDSCTLSGVHNVLQMRTTISCVYGECCCSTLWRQLAHK